MENYGKSSRNLLGVKFAAKPSLRAYIGTI
jgi:hypothetical protein